MARDVTDETPISSRKDLIAALADGAKPRDAWRIGTEHEKFGFYQDGLRPVPYEGPRGVRALLEGMGMILGWEPIMDEANIIGLVDPTGGGAISLEPGGQFELSGAPLETIHQTCREVHAHLAQLREVAQPLGIGFLGLGFSPLWTLAETPKMPKHRYDIMTRYMPKVGARGLDMMYRTCTVQVNLDFADEADMVKKLRVSLALQPVATAIFANSPFTEGRPNGFLSLRSEIWKDTDRARSGMLPFAFEPGMGFEAYVDYALDVPMYFVKRGGAYHDVAGASFRDLLDGRLDALPGERATLADWKNHLSTIFPEVRLKSFLEMRGADGGPWRRLCALPAFWVGLLYDEAVLDEAWQMVKDWTEGERQTMRDAVPKTALATPFRRGRVLDIAREATALARKGLARRAKLGWAGPDETQFLEPVEQIVESGKTPAENLVAQYEGEWGGDLRHLFIEHAY